MLFLFDKENFENQNVEKDKGKSMSSEELKKLNSDMSERLFWLNVFSGLLFLFICYYILLKKEKISYLPLVNYVPFFITILFTWFFLIYHYYSEKDNILSIDDEKEELKKLQNEIKADKTIITTFPLILFALGILLRDVPCGACVKVLKFNYTVIMNIFLLATLFGIILPFLIDTLIIDYTDLKRLLLFENLEFISISYGFGFLLLILLIVYVNNK